MHSLFVYQWLIWKGANSDALICRLMVATLVIHGITWITTHLPTPKGWKAELA